MHKIVAFAVFIKLFAVASITLASQVTMLTPQEQQYLQTLGRISYCTAPDSMPLDKIRNGQHLGIGAEYFKIFQQFIKVPFELIGTTSWDQSLNFIKQGKCDIIGLAARTPQREQYLYFTNSYVDIPFVLVTTQEKFFVSTFSQLTDKKLGVVKGYAYVDLLSNRYPDLQLVEVSTGKEGLEKVIKGELFGHLSGLHLAGYSIQAGGYTSLKINGQFDELSVITLGLGISKNRPQLEAIFNKAIAFVDPLDKQRIDNSWLAIKYDITEDYQRIIQFSIFGSIVLLFLFYRQFQLRKHNQELAIREQQIWKQGNYDFLTDLPNRRLFQERIEEQITLSKRTKEMFAVLLIDLDQFKEVNDSLGHDQGDDLLKQASQRIVDSLRGSDTVARLGGDEFVVILRSIKHEKSIEGICNKITTKLQQPFLLTEKAFISASIGITIFPKDSLTMLELLKNADQAMYAAKANGRNRYHYFTDRMQKLALERAQLIRDLHKAIKEQQFELYYQPIECLTTGKIMKAEALLRWHHPEKGMVSPVDFIPLLEETRLIIDVGQWAFIESAKQVKIWRAKFHPYFQINVNTSPVQFQDHSTHTWSDLIADMQVPASAIGIEITENMLMEDHDNFSEHLITLRDLGFQVSLDDFGTGYSSLAYLKRFDIDFLKIDKSFVNHITHDSDDKTLCEAIIVMAHQLGLKVIAEGIETNTQRDILIECGCNLGQGFHLAKPMSATDFEVFIEEMK